MHVFKHRSRLSESVNEWMMDHGNGRFWIAQTYRDDVDKFLYLMVIIEDDDFAIQYKLEMGEYVLEYKVIES